MHYVDCFTSDEMADVGMMFRPNLLRVQITCVAMCVLFLFIASTDLQIRLNGSGNNISGRVEIFNPNFGWGTVCGYSWDMTDSNVVCRQLGFTGANAVRHEAYYGKGSGPILLSEVECNGKESYIWNCSHRGWNIKGLYCSHWRDAGVECLCREGSTFDGSRCVGMYPFMYYHLKNICTSIS